MKVKFRDVMCMGNKTYLAGEDVDVSDISGQQLIDKEYADFVKEDDSAPKPKTPKKTDNKAE